MPVKYSYRQISLKDSFSDCQDIFVDDAPSFFQLLDEHFDIQEFIPSVFRNAFYQHFGRKRDYPLEAFLSALILQKIFSIPSDSLLLLFLRLCRELREFCGFSRVPDAPLLTRFKQNFEPYISLMFEQMVDYTEPICQMIDSKLAKILTFDTSGIELYVTENNPKNLNSLIRKLKTFYKDKPEVDPYSMAYGLMPTPVNPVIHSYYADKCKSKKKNVAAGAVMHKICNIIFAMLRDNKPFKIITPQEHCEQYFAAHPGKAQNAA